MLPALLRLNPRRFSSIHSAYTLRTSKQVHDFTAGTLDANPDYLISSSSSVSDLIVSKSYCTITPKYFALSDFETQLVPEVDNIARGDVSFDARGISFFLQSVRALVSGVENRTFYRFLFVCFFFFFRKKKNFSNFLNLSKVQSSFLQYANISREI